MRRTSLNPYHAVAIYSADTAQSLQGHLYSPTERLPMMQFFAPGETQVTGWELINVETGAIVSQASAAWQAADITEPQVGTFQTYFGTALLNPVPAGTYRAKITMGSGATLWSHAICCSPLFDSAAIGSGGSTVTGESCFDGGGNFGFTLSAAANVLITVRLKGGAVVASGLGSVSFSGAAAPGLNTYIITSGAGDYEESNGGIASFGRTYELNFNGESPCASATITQVSDDALYGEELMRLVWSAEKDNMPFGILYQEQTGSKFYKQELFGKFWQLNISPFIEEEVLVSKDGRPKLRSVTAANIYQLEMWPLPDYLQSVISSQALAPTIELHDMAGAVTSIDRMDVAASEIGDDDRRKGTFSFRTATRFDPSCEEDFVVN